MMVERYPNLKEEVGGSIPSYEISSLHEGKLARWSTVSYALALAYRPTVSKKEMNKITKIHPCQPTTYAKSQNQWNPQNFHWFRV